VILAGRRINDGMGVYVAGRVARLMMTRGLPVVDSRILLLGVAFKENCPDTRNSKAVDIVKELRQLNAVVDIWDPVVSPADCRRQSGLTCLAEEPQKQSYDAIVVAVGHREFVALGAAGVRMFGKLGAVLFDVKSIFPQSDSDGRL
jgi:UDP-N-acetyl-D-galactosamine dehydrogenase